MEHLQLTWMLPLSDGVQALSKTTQEPAIPPHPFAPAPHVDVREYATRGVVTMGGCGPQSSREIAESGALDGCLTSIVDI
jgi:hypothetical protein